MSNEQRVAAPGAQERSNAALPAAGATAALASETPTLAFSIEDAAAHPHATAPTVVFSLAVDADGAAIRSIALDVQIRIAAAARAYHQGETRRLYDLFGPREDWGRSLQGLFWTRAGVVVPAFESRTRVDLPVACTYDLEVASSRYFDALDRGSARLEFLFSGTIFYAGPNGALRAARVPWDREATFDLPIDVWRAAIDSHFPGTGWLRVRRDVIERLRAFRSERGHTSWEATFEALLGETGART